MLVDLLIPTCFAQWSDLFNHNQTLWEDLVNKDSRFADFVRFCPHTYLHMHSTICATFMGGNYNQLNSSETKSNLKLFSKWPHFEIVSKKLTPFDY